MPSLARICLCAAGPYSASDDIFSADIWEASPFSAKRVVETLTLPIDLEVPSPRPGPPSSIVTDGNVGIKRPHVERLRVGDKHLELEKKDMIPGCPIGGKKKRRRRRMFLVVECRLRTIFR